jgi:triosephosphate isomerase
LQDETSKHDIVICPPFTLLRDMAEKVPGTGIKIGGQDCSPKTSGSYTGDVSAAMLKDMTCDYVIVGHSERRQIHGEASELIRQKAESAHNEDLIPIICVGETLSERENGSYKSVIERQVLTSTPSSANTKPIVLAYEPVWAIGTDRIPSVEEVHEIHDFILKVITKKFPSQSPKIIYGGSVNSTNSKAFLETPTVDGLLIGRASLDADEFVNIIKSA